MNRQESVGGVYLLPMDLPSYMKIHPSSARTISLTPHGTSSADALELVEDDLVRGVSSGIEGIDPLGRPLRIYLDLCGLLADFHEANDGLATLNHGGNAGCNMCTFRQNTSQYNTRSKHAYNVRAHSRNSGYQRTTWRYNAVHSAGMSNDDANFLGLKPKSSLSSNDTLRMRLESRMTAAPSSPAFEHTIFPFKAFQCSIVAPDHLLSGNIKNILNAVFHALPDNNARSLLDKSFVAVLPRAGLYPQPKIYNFDGKHVRSCSFSILFSIFTVAPYVLYNYLSTADTPPAQDLRDIVDLLYLLFEIVNNVDQLVSASNASADILDKPNLHRLLELVVHTIPMYGHAHNISDLTFEHKHQSLKRAHHRANNHEKSNHHFSVRAELFDVWRARVTGAYYRLSSSESTEEVTVAARQELYKLVFGVSAVELDTPSNREFLPSVDRMLKGLFNPSLCSELAYRARVGGSLFPWTYPSHPWRPSGLPLKLEKFVDETILSVDNLAHLLQCPTDLLAKRYRFYLQASRGSFSAGIARVGSVVEWYGPSPSSSPQLFLLLGVVLGRSSPLSFFGISCNGSPTANSAFEPPLPRLLIPPPSSAVIQLIEFLPPTIRRPLTCPCFYKTEDLDIHRFPLNKNNSFLSETYLAVPNVNSCVSSGVTSADVLCRISDVIPSDC